MLHFDTSTVLVASFCFLVHLAYRYRRRSLLPLPPGPTRWPIIGNTLMIPLTNVHKFYKDLGKKLGLKIMYLEALGQSILVINDVTIAQDLLEKRSTTYSSRPDIPMLADVVGHRTFFAFMPYGNEWRAHRRLFTQHFSIKTLPRIEEKSLEFVRKGLLTNFLEYPEDFYHHIRNWIGGLSTSMTYGLPVQRQHDPLIHFAERALGGSAAAASPGRFLVNVVPWLKYVPDWMPGAGFKRLGKSIMKELVQLREEPYQAVLQMIDNGTAPVSFVSETLEILRDQPNFDPQDRYVKQAAEQVFGAASDTTRAAVSTLILVLLVHPEIQRNAQQEVDSVVGHDRLPDFSDIPHLKYLSAVIKESLRWNPVLPTALPHLASEDDEYMGYFIPRVPSSCQTLSTCPSVSTSVELNKENLCFVISAMLHDEETFPDPEKFDPERFIKNGILRDDIIDPETVATFGFGRRICPGSHIALANLRIAAASILHLFDLLPPLDEDGKPIEPKAIFSSDSVGSEPQNLIVESFLEKGKDVHGLLKEYMGTEPM
ncbi:hypothetical protein D9756_010547 [Leucocoprinus leucothites]|uniref:Cytochrome P450 n=1 Tax=Leucocoprinus leucothites TaxID=201217 RepID=A0A8H5CRR5_9AGAR|nr:hypothetical protein D9756_010547 [Leucoagaricus leucothites]